MGQTVRVDHDEYLADLAARPSTDPLENLIEQGLARPALVTRTDFAGMPRGTSTVSSAEILRDVRGRW